MKDEITMDDKYTIKIVILILVLLCALPVSVIVTYNACYKERGLAMSVGFCMSIIFVFGMIAVILERRYAIATVISGGIEEVKKEQSQNPGVHIHVGGDGAVVLGDGQATVNKPITMPKSDEGLQELLAQLQKHFEDVQKSPSTTISDKEKEMAADAHDDLKKAIESKKESKFDVTAEGLKGAATAVAGAFPAIFEVLQKIKELVFK